MSSEIKSFSAANRKSFMFELSLCEEGFPFSKEKKNSEKKR